MAIKGISDSASKLPSGNLYPKVRVTVHTQVFLTLPFRNAVSSSITRFNLGGASKLFFHGRLTACSGYIITLIQKPLHPHTNELFLCMFCIPNLNLPSRASSTLLITTNTQILIPAVHSCFTLTEGARPTASMRMAGAAMRMPRRAPHARVSVSRCSQANGRSFDRVKIRAIVS